MNLEDMKIWTWDFIAEKTGKFSDYYKMGTCQGSGSYGQVWKCMHKKTN